MNTFWLLISLCVAKECIGEKVIHTDSGRIRGKEIKLLNTEVFAFLGIPYAIAPIGELRFREPQPVSQWEDIFNATVIAPICMQDPVYPFEWVPSNQRYKSEDCLYLNLWVPDKSNEGKPFSTMIWIHGGGYNTGSVNMDAHYGRYLASIGNVIVASLNYRLGSFGFLNFDDDKIPGNLALLDQVMALKWIHRNIEHFGGDKNEITIFGSSCGSISVSYHLISPLTKGLFKRAILQSGAHTNPFFMGDAYTNKKISEIIALNAGCGTSGGNFSSNDVIACLRKVDARRLAAVEKSFMDKKGTFLSFFPQKGGKYMPENPIKNIDDNLVHDVEVMIGKVPDEGSRVMSLFKTEVQEQDNPVITKSEAEHFLSTFFNISGNRLKRIIEEYLGNLPDDDHSSIFLRTMDAIGDGILWCGIVNMTEKLSRNRTVYSYTFDHARIKAGYKQWERVAHFAEVYFVFGLPFMFPENYTPEEEDFSAQIIRLWTSFAKTGKPCFSNSGNEWLPFDEKNRYNIHLKLGNIHRVKEEAKKECQVWEEIYQI